MKNKILKISLIIALVISIVFLIYVMSIRTDQRQQMINDNIASQFQTVEDAKLCKIETKGFFGLIGVMYVKNEDISKLENNNSVAVKLYSPLKKMKDEYINAPDIEKIEINISQDDFIVFVKEHMSQYRDNL